jgi:hypothetical protein
MIPPRDDDSLLLESLTRDGITRRRPRFEVESQPARCPKCNRVMVAYVGRHGPTFLCGCKGHTPPDEKS